MPQSVASLVCCSLTLSIARSQIHRADGSALPEDAAVLWPDAKPVMATSQAAVWNVAAAAACRDDGASSTTAGLVQRTDAQYRCDQASIILCFPLSFSPQLLYSLVCFPSPLLSLQHVIICNHAVRCFQFCRFLLQISEIDSHHDSLKSEESTLRAGPPNRGGTPDYQLESSRLKRQLAAMQVCGCNDGSPLLLVHRSKRLV